MTRNSFTTAAAAPSDLQKEQYITAVIEKESIDSIETKPYDQIPPGTYQIVGPGSVPANDSQDAPGTNPEDDESGYMKHVNNVTWITGTAALLGLIGVVWGLILAFKK